MSFSTLTQLELVVDKLETPKKVWPHFNFQGEENEGNPSPLGFRSFHLNPKGFSNTPLVPQTTHAKASSHMPSLIRDFVAHVFELRCVILDFPEF